ncbi:MAG TPA: FlgD immunoglobulin-like domain containing protein, partial [Bacteroidota bacterium]|nr:FlgD immunoglobulin-like domain containing protein [Bacteroidota bacterium]
ANPACDIGEGLRVDLLAFSTYTQIDTYRVRFQPGTGTYPITFSWDNIFIGSVCDSMVLKDEFGGSNVYSRMDVGNSASVTNSSITSILMIRYGAFPLINDVRPPPPRTPGGYMLAQNYPNPFNPTTRVTFSTEHTSLITVTVYDVLGREITVLADDEYYRGVYSVSWNATNAHGSPMPSGVYYVRMTAVPQSAGEGRGGSYSEIRKMLLLK